MLFSKSSGGKPKKKKKQLKVPKLVILSSVTKNSANYCIACISVGHRHWLPEFCITNLWRWPCKLIYHGTCSATARNRHEPSFAIFLRCKSSDLR